MPDKNDNLKKKNDFLEAKMYYYNTDALTERDYILNSKNSKITPSDPKVNSVKIEPASVKNPAVLTARTKPRPKRVKSAKDSSQKKVLERLAGLEDMYKQLIHTLNISKVSVEIDSTKEDNEKFADQISDLEQERLTLLEQITALEAQVAFLAETTAEKNELKDQLTVLNKEKQDLENKISELNKQINDFSQTVSNLENKKSIIYLSKERETLESRIAVIMQEKRELYLHIQKLSADNDALTKKMTLVEDREKAVAYLDKKSAMFEEELKETEKKNAALSERISEFAGKTDKLTRENEELLKQYQTLAKQLKDQQDWQEKINTLISEKNSLTEKAKQLNAENQELMKSIIEKERNTKIDIQKQRLTERVDEMEQERLHLFKIIGEMEEEKKCSPDLIEKNERLSQENEELKNENIRDKKQLSEFIKNAKIMENEISQLKEKRASRLELEQEKGRLIKRIKDLEEQSDRLAANIIDLNAQISAGRKESMGLEHLRKEITRLEEEKNSLLVQSKQDKAKIAELIEIISAKKGSENLNADKITQLNNENKKLVEQLKTIPSNQPVNYILDMEKLAELKEFVLESIQTRRWKSTEFVNGAYDAVGLFYRTILHERPIKPHK